MAAVHASKRSHNRIRSSSDPFVDPSFPSISFRPSRSSAPPPAPPPKPAKSSKMPPQRDTTDAVYETAPVGNPDTGPRHKMTKSHTVIQPSSNGNSRTTGRRSQSHDSVLAAAAAVEKAKNGGKPRSKKGSQHADVIDRMDFTGVGPMFHHDGPFDACAPSRNRHRTKAPMLAWSSRSTRDTSAGQSPDSGLYPTEERYEPYYEPPKKKVDAIAEAWGIHEPEPYEEFFAGGGNQGDTPTSSIYGGKEGHTPRSAHGKRKDSRDLRDTYRDYPDDARLAENRRSIIPPPQPIFIPDAQGDIDLPKNSPPPSNRPDGPKRTKSLMHRIRKMRDAPNVPVSDDVLPPSSPTTAENLGSGNIPNTPRPTHRSQHSFLGRFASGRGGSNQKESISPTSENSEAFIFIEDSRAQNKELPSPPGEKSPEIGVQPSVTGPGSPGLGRTSSLLQKVRGVVMGTK